MVMEMTRGGVVWVLLVIVPAAAGRVGEVLVST